MVSLKPMTRQMCHEFYREVQNDPAIGHYYEYVYTLEIADSYFERKMAVMLYDMLREITLYTPPWGILTGVRPAKIAGSLLTSGNGVMKTKKTLM